MAIRQIRWSVESAVGKIARVAAVCGCGGEPWACIAAVQQTIASSTARLRSVPKQNRTWVRVIRFCDRQGMGNPAMAWTAYGVKRLDRIREGKRAVLCWRIEAMGSIVDAATAKPG
jgi:hypothetical protein